MKLTSAIFLAHLSLVATIFGCNEKDGDVINCEKWNTDTKLTYDVELKEVNFINDSITSIKTNSYKADLELIELGENNIIKWHIRQPFKRPDSLITQLERSLSDTLDYREILQIVYQTNERGQYEKIINWPQIEKFSDSVWNRNFHDEKMDSSKMKMITKLKSTFMNRHAIEARLTRDILALHVIYNKKHSETETKSEDEVAGVDSLNLTQITTSRIVNNYDDITVVKITHELNPIQTKKQYDTFISEFTSDTLTSVVQVRDTIYVDYNNVTGWPKQVEYWRFISIGNREKQIGASLIQIAK